MFESLKIHGTQTKEHQANLYKCKKIASSSNLISDQAGPELTGPLYRGSK